jgi:hypothetical protein
MLSSKDERPPNPQLRVLARHAGHVKTSIRQRRFEDRSSMVVRPKEARWVVQFLVCNCFSSGIDPIFLFDTEHRGRTASVQGISSIRLSR